MHTTTLGYPRIGRQRELKRALEAYWSGRSDEAALLERAASIRRENLLVQREAGIDVVPVNDFSLYDHVLDTCVMLGAVPERFDGPRDLVAYFLMARGRAPGTERAVPPLEMTKWFDTNYHYLVPELDDATRFAYRRGKAAAELAEAQALGVPARPILLGPLSFVLLAKDAARHPAPLSMLERVTDAYCEAVEDLAALGAEWVELDEPCLVLDLEPDVYRAYEKTYARLARTRGKLLVATYFGALGDNLDLAARLPVSGLHVDALAAPDECVELARKLGPDRTLSIGLVDGRNVFCADLSRALRVGERVLEHVHPDRLWIAPTTSLLHVPIDVTLETRIAPEIRESLAFARQKLSELVVLKRGLLEGRESVRDAIERAERALARRRAAPGVVNREVRARLAALSPQETRRPKSVNERRPLQRSALRLPPLPTTTIGSFPQTEEVRKLRAARRSGSLSEEAYTAELRRVLDETIAIQERLGLDVLVHGEAERADMVEYFGAQLEGMAVTEHGWVQSYGSRCVRPPIIYGDVARPRPITVEWATYAQSRTSRPVKGMLTGPITMLKWSFVRDDEPLSHTCRTMALALRDEVADLERAGIRIIQVDEPAFREALPLRRAAREDYLRWAVECFRIATSGVRDRTQIHTHMCYSEFGDVIDAIAALDADVISIESARSQMELLPEFAKHDYPGDIGLGIYDIHSPRVPAREEMEALLERALSVLDPDRVWVNPDCGLKTRRWSEVMPALENMVQAARAVRARITRPTS